MSKKEVSAKITTDRRELKTLQLRTALGQEYDGLPQ